MLTSFGDIALKRRYDTLVVGRVVEVVAVDHQGRSSAAVTYRDDDGAVGNLIVTVDQLPTISEASTSRIAAPKELAGKKLPAVAATMEARHQFGRIPTGIPHNDRCFGIDRLSSEAQEPC